MNAPAIALFWRRGREIHWYLCPILNAHGGRPWRWANTTTRTREEIADA